MKCEKDRSSAKKFCPSRRIDDMKIALHLRRPGQTGKLSEFPEHLTSFYGRFPPGAGECGSFDRIYVGDEFCINRLPGLNELEFFCRFAAEQNLKMTLLTPVLTDKGLKRCSPLFEELRKRARGAEVVANDIGVLLHLKRRYPGFCLAAGRLLNKGFKDPRLRHEKNRQLKELGDCSFDQGEFREKMMSLSVVRLERDLLPYGATVPGDVFAPATSVYFPFGYFTAGRVCWTASFRQSPRESFMPPDNCSRLCDEMMFELKDESFSFRIIQNGNALFYLYPFSMLTSLEDRAKEKDLRLVYQGFIV